MNFPSHLFLPLSGAVLLAAVVIGTSLWPEPEVPPVRFEPPPVAAPVYVPPPAPPPAPRPARPVTRAMPPAPPVQPPPPPVAVRPSEPVQVAPAPAYPPSQGAPGQAPAPAQGKRISMMQRAANLMEKGIPTLEKARDEALARGDQAEFQRLDKSITQHRARLEQMRGRTATAHTPDGGELPKM